MEEQAKVSGNRGYVETGNLIRNDALVIGGPKLFSKEFPTGEGWYTLNLRFNLVLTVGTGTTPKSEGELRIIRKILLKTDRGEILANLPGRALYKIATHRKRAAPRKDAIAAANGTYRVNIPILFTDERMIRPEDTILDTARYQSISCEITMGNVDDLLAVTGTASVTATVDVEVERSLGVLPEDARPFYHVNYEYRQPVDANVTTSIDIDRSADMAIKRLYVHASASGTAGVPLSGDNADDVQDIVTIKDQNRDIVKSRVHEMIQDQNKADYALESVLAGYEIFDFVADGSINSALSTGNKSVLQYSWQNKAGVAANDIVTLFSENIRTLR